MSTLQDELRPHPLTSADAPVMYRARQVRALCDELDRKDAEIARLRAALNSIAFDRSPFEGLVHARRIAAAALKGEAS